jgi:hypothetical protein
VRRDRLAGALLAVTVPMTVGEFVEVQKLSPEDLRKRFGLPPACQPAVTALTTEPAANRVTVAVECRATPAKRPAPTAPATPPR